MYIIVAKVSQNSTRANRVEAITGSSPRTILRMGSPRNGQRNMPWRQAASIRRVNTSDHASTTNAHTALITGQLQPIIPGSSVDAAPHARCTTAMITWDSPAMNSSNVPTVVAVSMISALSSRWANPSG